MADQNIEYGQNLETAAYSFGDKNGKYDLMPWDSADEVIDSASMEKPIGKYKPGVYKDEIGVKIKKENENYKFNDDNGDSTVNNVTLTVDKGRLLASVSVPSFVYTGEKAEPEITVVPVRDESVDPASMDDPGKPDDVKYYAISKDGKRQSLLRAPKDTGIYAVEVVFEENEYYGKVTATDTFIIRKARCDVEAPDVPDMKYREGLTLADQSLPKGWEWVDQDKELSIGGVREYAVYTPEDTRNYYSAVRLVEFDVYEHEEPAVPDIPDSPSDTDDPTSTDDPASSGDSSDTDKSSKTGDDINLTLWFTIMLIAGVLSVVAFVTRKVRK